MSQFWDRIKPSKPPPRVVDLQVAGDARSVRLVWESGAQVSLPARTLRQVCPCAACVDEWTSKRTLDVDAVAQDIALTQVAPVGNYALSFTFSDAHATGIYTWELLRELSAPLGSS